MDGDGSTSAYLPWFIKPLLSNFSSNASLCCRRHGPLLHSDISVRLLNGLAYSCYSILFFLLHLQRKRWIQQRFSNESPYMRLDHRSDGSIDLLNEDMLVLDPLTFRCWIIEDRLRLVCAESSLACLNVTVNSYSLIMI